MNESGDEISFTVRTADEFEEAVPAIDLVPVMIDATKQAGETEKSRKRRLAALLGVMFARYGKDGRLQRDITLLMDPGPQESRKGTPVRRLRPDGRPGKRIGRLVSPRPETYRQARRRAEPTVDLTIGNTDRCPTCLRIVDEWWSMQCRRCDCGWSAVGCRHCLDELALACLDSRELVEE